MEEQHFIQCDIHGRQEETFVCQHIVQSLHDEIPRGFNWPASSTQNRPDAWCHECHEKVEKSNWEWTEKNLKFANVHSLCGLCYDRAKEIAFSNE